MSFITKRERVFNEYDLFDLPPRNEGKLKAYASCTDARAWSHFCSDKTEHLVEIIKRNNETCRTKYVPTDVIVETLMAAKNAEISRLKHKIEEFEQMLAAYDQLDLTCDQKCEIAAAHAAIKAANKELDELCLDLDLSGFTEGIDSDAFETGKSRGDEPNRVRGDEILTSKGSESAKSRGDDWSFGKESTRMEGPRMEAKSNQAGLACQCDVSTSAHDPRIQEMQETIISKDAKLSAMQNTIAVMENDVCEPYCIYAHIYTALEKIFGVLCQNDKYKLYLNLMTAGKDTRCIDIKGKILFKLKVLERFSLALIAPCSQEMRDSNIDCACLRAEVVARLDFPPLSQESQQPCLDSKRAQLVADIMENEEMKELLSKDSVSEKRDDEQTEDGFGFDTYSIDTENLKRLKNLQENYDDLMTCYEKLKYEKDTLQAKCRKYEELELEFDNLKGQLREYNVLWTEREHYRKRSKDIDSLKEQYLVLADETSNLETQLKAEFEINHMKSIKIEDLRNENIALERKINDALISFEKEKNALQCKLKETECTVMCQDQQIKSLSMQIDRLLDQSQDKIEEPEDPSHSLILIDEIESLKVQIKNLKDALYCSEEEKQHLQDDFEDKLKIINDLRMEIEDWKSSYRNKVQQNENLEKYTNNFQDEMQRLIEENRTLSHDVEEKTIVVGNLINVINNKSQEIKQLSEQIEQKDKEKDMLYNEVEELREMYKHNISAVEDEKQKALECLQLVKQESQELLTKVKDYNDVLNQNNGMSKSLETKSKDYDEVKKMLKNTMEENKKLQIDLIKENDNSVLLQEIQSLREINSFAINNIKDLQDQKNEYKASLEITKKESQILENKILEFQNVSRQTDSLKEAHTNLLSEKDKTENELKMKKKELEEALHSLNLYKKESTELVNKLDEAHKWHNELLMTEKRTLQSELKDKSDNLQRLLESLNDKNELLFETSKKVASLENELINLKKSHSDILQEKTILQKDFDNKTEDLNNLYNNLENKIEENRELLEKIKVLELSQKATDINMVALQNENQITKTTLTAIQKESAALIDKLKQYETLESEYEKLKFENECMQSELSHQMTLFKEIQRENQELSSQSHHLQELNEDLEKSLINTRSQLIAKPEHKTISYEDILIELEDMKKDKLRNHDKIKNLLNRLDELDHINLNLSEDILARDDKIAILENHINQLEDEIRRLHSNLADVIDAGESINENSSIQVDQTIKTMEAHQSRATHNMKMEYVKLQSQHSKLEQQLSETKLKTEESFRDKNRYLSQIFQLEKERKIIVTDIKQLELKSVEDSDLNPDHCGVEEVISSLDRIKKNIDTKSVCLEQTILKVQTSSQLLLAKADEAKKLVEKEKQKIIMEKEEAIKDRLKMEKRVDELRNKLDNQINTDSKIIKDLEANVLNQKLLNEHTISKLKEELRVLQLSNENSLSALNDLQEKICKLTEENEKYLKLNKKLNIELESENKEKETLQNKLEDLCNKPVRNTGIQVHLHNDVKTMSSQTDKRTVYEFENYYPFLDADVTDINCSDKNVKKSLEAISYSNIMQATENKQVSNLLPKQNPQSMNEVQILTANIEPTFDFVRNSYLNYKIQRLSPGRLEQYSISNLDVSKNHPLNEDQGLRVINKHDANLIDIYDRSIQSVSSKIVDNEVVADNIAFRHDPQSPTKSSAFTAFDYTESIDCESNHKEVNKYNDKLYADRTSQESAEEADLFVIYKDSESNIENNNFDRKTPVTTMEQAEMIAESVPDYQSLKEKRSKKHQVKHMKKKTYDFCLEETDNEDDSVKPKLNINLPRVEIDSRSIIATSEGDKKSIDSYTLGIYVSPKQNSFSDITLERDIVLANLKQASLPTISNDENHFLGSYSMKLNSEEDISFDQESDIKQRIKNLPEQSEKRQKMLRNEIFDITSNSNNARKQINDDISHHKLSRVGAEVYLMRSKSNVKEQYKPADTNSKQQRNFGLDYILESVQREMSPINVKALNILNELRKSKSDDTLILGNTTNETVPSKPSPLNVSSIEYKTISSPSRSFGKISDKSHSKSLFERSVMAKIEDNINDYETTIKNLTQTLENTERDYRKRLEAIKLQYDMNIKNILTEHNLGVKNIQGLHEETLQDFIKVHENEIENLRIMSIEANRRAEKLEKENRSLRSKIQEHSSTTGLEEEPTRIASETKKRRRSRVDTKMLTKTNVEAFNVKPRIRSHGPCTCCLDANVSDTIRNIFEQVDVDQRKMAEHTYVKYIANKILNGNVEALDAQELSFLHLKVCRTWKTKLTKEKIIDSLETELMHKQRHAQQHIAELDRKVAEERRRLQEVREAVCRETPVALSGPQSEVPHGPPPVTAADKDFVCNCNTRSCGIELGERRSAGDVAPGASTGGQKPKRVRNESNRAVLAKIDAEERRDKKLYNDEPPTRLRRSHDRTPLRFHKK